MAEQSVGPELNARVARAIGWHRVEPGQYIPYGNWADAKDRGMYAPNAWNPSEEIEYAIRAAAEMNRRPDVMSVETSFGEGYAWAAVTLKSCDTFAKRIPLSDNSDNDDEALALAISLAIAEAGEA